ncbi:MAG TPA: FAD-dependent oxidoreductase [Candidatus Limnocylindrales bacterium]|nr:FAD-dependent oxidoreductase [Candidatus Limnocylindrales bacterium]
MTTASNGGGNGHAPDLLVVGAGVMGAWTALEARRGGRSVTLLDAFGAGHARATSGDQTRISRCGHGADTLYTRWARESLGGWRQLEAETGLVLFRQAGALWFTGEDRGFVDATVPTFHSLDIPVEVLSADEVHHRWPQIATDDTTGALYEPEAGLLMAARGCVAATRRLVELGGTFGIAAVRPGRADGSRLLDVVDGAGRHLAAETFVFAAGPWLPRLFPDAVGDLISVTKQDVVYLGPAAGDERWTDGAIPCWVDMAHPFYGLPSAEGGGFKVAPDRFGPAWDPTAGDRLVDPDAVRVAREYAARRFPDLARQPVIEARVCQYEMTPDSHFVVDRHPAFDNVWLVGGGSGHGYKHGPAIGAHVVGRLDGEPPLPDDRFALARPGVTTGTYRIGGDGLVAAWDAGA